MSSLQSFIDYLEEQLRNHSIYVWGAQGQGKGTISEAWIKTREKDSKNADRAIAFWKKQCAAGYGDVLRAFDCSGLAMFFLQNTAGLSSSDMSANSLMGKCGIIKKADVRRGDWVFKKYTSGEEKGKAYHVGYVVDDALNVIEAKGRDYGVIKTSLNAGTWNVYGRPSYFKAEIEAAAGGNQQSAANTYTVQKGDNLTKIAAAHGVTLKNLVAANPQIANPNLIKVGETINIPSGTASPPAPAAPSAPAAGGWEVSRVLKIAKPIIKGDDVKALQRALIANNYNCGATGADGFYGKNTAYAVRCYQAYKGLVVDGKAGKHTVTALGGTWRG